MIDCGLEAEEEKEEDDDDEEERSDFGSMKISKSELR